MRLVDDREVDALETLYQGSVQGDTLPGVCAMRLQSKATDIRNKLCRWLVTAGTEEGLMYLPSSPMG